MTTATVDNASKTELRILCKSAGIKGYGNMNNDQMRAALTTHAGNKQNQEPAAAKKPEPKAGAPVARRGGEPSIRKWLAEQFKKKGSVPVADAIAYADRTGRSKVTVYRMAAACGHRAQKGVFVPI